MQKPNFSFEKRIWKRGFKVVAGVDEVGRGAFAGPVVAACVAFNSMINVKWPKVNGIRIDDSKKLTKLQRARADKWIKKYALTWGVGSASVSEINRLGLVRATNSGFRRAIADAQKRLEGRIDYLLIDAFYIPYVRGLRRRNQTAIIDGDAKVFSIAAASIVAKVYRDKLMQNLGKQPRFKKYGWGKNKGYGTAEHRDAIKKYGVNRYHRKKFVEKL